jgi:hypothetical protein
MIDELVQTDFVVSPIALHSDKPFERKNARLACLDVAQGNEPRVFQKAVQVLLG